jgi:hypothetical protein
VVFYSKTLSLLLALIHGYCPDRQAGEEPLCKIQKDRVPCTWQLLRHYTSVTFSVAKGIIPQSQIKPNVQENQEVQYEKQISLCSTCVVLFAAVSRNRNRPWR